METLRQRLKEKDDTIEKQLQTVKSAQQEKKNSDCRFHEVAEHMKVKERKICVLQRKVCRAASLFRFCFMSFMLQKLLFVITEVSQDGFFCEGRFRS